MEGKLKVLFVESSANMCDRLMEVLDSAVTEVHCTSTAEKAFDFILTKKPDTIIWGVKYNYENGTKLTELRKENKPFSLILLPYYYSQQDYKNMDSYIRPDAFVNKDQAFEKLSKLILQLTACKQENSIFYKQAKTYSDVFLTDPLF
jgi:two-component SAPR family response regulator